MQFKANENTKNYIILAMLRNKRFDEMNIDWSNQNNVNWEDSNRQLMSIENGLRTGLTCLGSETRGNMYEEMCEIRESVQSTYYAAELSKDVTLEERLKIMHGCKGIVEGIDYLETLLQLHFPEEFPNELVQSILLNNSKSEPENPILTEITNAASVTDVEDLSYLTPAEPEDSYEDTIEDIIPSPTTSKPSQFNFSQPDLIDGMDPGLARFLYDTKKELTDNFTTMPKGFNNPEDLLVNGMDPKLFGTLLEQRDLRVAESTETTFQQTSTLDSTVVQ